MFLLDCCRQRRMIDPSPHLLSRQRANSLDTDSSLPPLLFLAAALLLFAWASVLLAARRRPTPVVALLAYSPSHAIVWLRVSAAAMVGVSAVAIVSGLTPGWPIAPQLAVAVLSAAAVLVAVHQLADRLAVSFPRAAQYLARPRRWFDGRGTSPANGDTPSANGSDSHGAPDNDYHTDPPPLTSAEIMNLDHYDIHMVRSISRMDDRDVQDIMVPRLDVDAVAVTSPLDELVNILVDTKHSRLPVYRGTMDDVVGVVHISDVLLTLANGPPGVPLESIMREPEFVAENMAVDDLLHLMRTKSLQMAIVVDEYGGVEGIVTLEDVLEEIVGEIEDEFGDDAGHEPTAAADGSWLVSATMPVEDVARVVGIELDYDDVNTIGGYVYSYVYARQGRMPAIGDVVAAAGLSIEVTQVRGRRIQQLRLTPTGADAAPPDPTGAPPA